MDSHMALKTQALATKRRPLTHCAHYYYNRTCNLGAECQFVHAVFVDPDAKDHQRAPVPAQLGRGRGGDAPSPKKNAAAARARKPAASNAIAAAAPRSRADLSTGSLPTPDRSLRSGSGSARSLE